MEPKSTASLAGAQAPPAPGARLPTSKRRKVILDSAIRLFADRGFRGTTTRSLAESAGVSEPILYRHFPTKESLYSAIIEYKAITVTPAFETIVSEEAAAGDDQGVFLKLGELVQARHRSDPAFVRLLLFSALEGHDLAKMFFERRVIAQFGFVAQYISQRIAAGAFRADTCPENAARAFLGSIYQRCLVTTIFCFEGDPNRDETFLSDHVTIFLQGIKAQ